MPQLIPWSPDEDTHLRHAVANGVPLVGLADKFNRSLSSVKMRAYKLGLSGLNLRIRL